VAKASRGVRRRRQIRPRVKLWVESDDGSVLCGGMCQILRAVQQTGSIKHAAGEVGRSYRFIWSRIKDAEAALGHRLVLTQIGGPDERRSTLTPLAEALLDEFDALRSQVHQLVDEDFAKRLQRAVAKHAEGRAFRL
jgi:molybdate transport system regulatory protein